jgi:transcriptional regulator with XRE-family HTH domain
MPVIDDRDPEVVALGEAIRDQRHDRHLSLQALALQADISFKHLGEIERGRVDPGWTTVRKIAGALGLTACDLETMAYGSTGDDDP